MNLSFKQKRLKNGLRLVWSPMKTESVSVHLLVRVGSRDEESRINGVSHFLEHMVFKGTEKWPTPMGMNKVIDSVGGQFNAFTNRENTGFWVKLHKDYLSLGLEFVYQAVFKPLLIKEELDKERGVILEEIKMYEDNPMSKVYRQFVSQVYGLTRLGQDVIGKPENIKSLTRDDFIKHLDRWYQPKNMVLAVAGGVEEKDLQQVEAFFGKEIGGSEVEMKRQIVKLKQGRPKVEVVYKDIKQAHFCLGVRALKRTDKDRYAWGALDRVLGGNTSSRLWDEIREKRGLVYYVRSSASGFADTGYLVAQAGCDVDRVEEAIKVTLAEFLKLKNEKTTIDDEELKMGKEYFKGRLALDLEDSQEVAGFLADDWLMEGKNREIKEILAKVKKVEKQDVLRVAGKIFTADRLNLTVVGPFKDSKKFDKLVESI